MAASKLNQPAAFEFGPFRVIPSERQLLRDDRTVPLPPKAFDLLLLLVEKSGHLIEKEELIETLWPNSFVEEANLTHHIWTLRKALGKKDDGQHYIETVSRRGYRFAAGVQAHENHSVTYIKPTVSTRPVEAKVGLFSSPIRAGIACVLVLIMALSLGYFAYSRLQPTQTTSPSNIVLLVLPFENAGANPDEQYFSDGMTEEMITELANLEQQRLRVIPRASALRIKSSGKDVYQTARELNVDYVLESSVFRSGSRVRINSRLIKVSDQSYVWADSYERELRDVLVLQNEVARSISQQIAHQVDAPQPSNAHQIDPEAYEAYLKGKYFFDKFTESGMRTSIEYFKRAIEKEPGYAPPYARMARAYGVLGNFNSLPPDEAYPKQKEAAQRALEIDERSGEARTALGWTMLFYDRDWNGAKEQFEKAIALNPSFPAAHQGYATYLIAMGDFDRGISEILKAQQLDPVNLNIKGDVGWDLYFARRTDESIAQLKQVLEMDPNFSIAHFFLALAYQEKGMFDQAIAEAQAVALFEGNEYRIATLGDAYARAGKKQEARNILTRLKKASREHYISPYTTGLIYASLGQNDEALDWLEKACNDRFWMMAFLKVDPRWDSLRSHPRFVEILRRTGLAS